MRLPVVLLDSVYFPGLYGDIALSRAEAQSLASFHALEGFGGLEVLLASPLDPAQPPSVSNLAPFAALVEASLDEADMGDPARDTVRLLVRDGYRVTLKGATRHSTLYDTPWDGVLASFTSQKPAAEGLDTPARAALERALFGAILVGAEANPPGPRLGYPELLEQVAAPYVELNRWRAPDWKLCYKAADLALDDPADRYAMLAAPDAGQQAVALDLTGRLEAIGQGERLVAFSDLLGEAVEVGLAQTLAALEAAAYIAREELVDLPSGTAKTLRNLARDLTPLRDRLEGLADTVADHAASAAPDADA